MKSFRIYRAKQVGSEVEEHARRWGFIKIEDLEGRLGLKWKEIEKRYGALFRYMPCDDDLNPKVPTFGGYDEFVSAGWVEQILNAVEAGVHHLTIQVWNDLNLHEEIPNNCWNSYWDQNDWEDGILLAFAFDANGEPVKWPVRVVAYADKRYFYSLEEFEEALNNGLELHYDWGVGAVDMGTGAVYGWTQFPDLYKEEKKGWYPPKDFYWRNVARVEW